MAAKYVTEWGNDNNTGDDWTNAKRTLQGAVDASADPIYAKGYYSEGITLGADLEGDKICIINGSDPAVTTMSANGYENVSADGYSSIGGAIGPWTDCDFTNCSYLSNGQLTRVLVCNFSKNSPTIGTYFTKIDQCTIHSGDFLDFQFSPVGTYSNSIFSNILMRFHPNMTTLNYSLIINTSIKMDGGGLGSDETTFTYPTGADDDAKLLDLRSRMATVYGGLATSYLIGCKYYSGSYNDIFVNADNGDFTLLPDSIPANMAYDGSYIGAKGIGYNIEFDTDFNSIVNISTTASTLGYVEDQEIDAACTSNIIDLGVVKNLYNINNLGLLAYRNGMQFNSESNLDTSIAAGTTLIVDESYLVIDNTITYNSTTYNPWDTFVVVTGVTSFTGTGYLRKVDQDKYPEKVQIKVSKTDPTLSGVATLTVYAIEDIQINEDANGIPTFGNADTGYVSGSAVDLDTRYIQIIVTIKALNLPAR